MPVDFGRTTADYVAHRVEFAPRLFERLKTFGIGVPDQKILDVGAGTGLFGQALIQTGAHVTLLDPSESLLANAATPDRIVARAEAIPFANEQFDVVSAAQCWHWFNRNLAPREILRILKPAGAVVVVYQTYIPLPNSIADATEQLILKHNPNWRHANSTGINGQVLRDLQSFSFVAIETFSFDLEVQFSHDAWQGFIRTTSPVGASMKPQQIEEFDWEHQRMLQNWPAKLAIPHRVFAAIARKPSLRV